MESYSNSSARVPESSGNREDRLQRRRERERARRASETAEQREERLRVRRARDRARRAAQTAEERDARLRQIRDNRRQSLATESEEERAVRLQQMRDRLASETEETPLKLSNSSFRFSAITNPLFHTSYSTCFRPHQPRRTSRAAPAAPHQPLSTRLRIHRIRAHARPHNAVHPPS